jgi:hypothetical protein
MRRPETDEPKKDMTLNVSQRTFDWVNRVAKAEGKSRSWIIEEILLDNLPEEFMEVADD